NAGGVNIIYGSSDGLTAKSGTQLNQFLTEGLDGLSGVPEEGDFFGWSLASGDLNSDGIQDLIVGSLNGISNQGMHVMFGGKDGLASAGDEVLVLDVGEAMTSGDFNGDGVDDIAAGNPDVRCSGSGCSPGIVRVLLGKKKATVGEFTSQIWRQPFVIASDDNVVVEEDNSVIISVTNNDLGRGVRILDFDQPETGTGFVRGVNGSGFSQLRYEANFRNFFGTVTFKYRVKAEGSNDVSEATVTVEVQPVNDIPTFLTNRTLPPALVGIPYETSIEVTDVEDDEITFFLGDLPNWISFRDDGVQNGNRIGTLTGTPLLSDIGLNEVFIGARDPQTSVSQTRFTVFVQLGAPATPAPVAPANSATVTELPVALVWTDVDGASSYDVQVSTIANFSSTVVDSSGIESDSLLLASLENNTTYFWRVRARNEIGQSDFTETFLFTTGNATNVANEEDTVAGNFALFPNYPNPFNDQTNIAYEIAKPSQVRITVFDIGGREVTTLVNAVQAAGRHVVRYANASAASGTYFYRIETPDYSEVRSMHVVN
ncbi:MAG: T9SS type A sorting domain-containing protein, partial [Rhodothermales bacterium]|nr:T9SS type A sorting domain-containing protein [Rhodothermales bacterium]